MANMGEVEKVWLMAIDNRIGNEGPTLHEKSHTKVRLRSCRPVSHEHGAKSRVAGQCRRHANCLGVGSRNKIGIWDAEGRKEQAGLPAIAVP
jgi:hypothetical protein